MTNSIRKELLLITATSLLPSKSKYGVKFVLREKEQSNAIRRVTQRAITNAHFISRFAAKKYLQNTATHLRCNNSSNITKIVISEKKLKKNQGVINKIEGVVPAINNYRKLFETKTKKNINEALTKIQSLGLLMKQFRGTTNLKRVKSLADQIYPISDEEMRIDDVREKYVLQKNIANFGQSYIEVSLHKKARRKSSYYGSLSEGTITDEEDITIN